MIATLLVTLAVIVFFGAPLTWLILSSLDPGLMTPEFRVPENPSYDNYVRLFVEAVGPVKPIQWIVNSLVISSATATLSTLISLAAGFVITRYRVPGSSYMLTSFVIFRLIPPLLIALPLMTLFRGWGLMNSMVALVIVLTALVLPFTMLMIEGYLRSIPPVYEEAAMIDGCSRLGAFMRVTLPLARPGLVAVWLLAFVFSWGEFVIPLFIIKVPELMPASVGLFFFYGQYGRIEYGKLSAFSILYSIPMLVIFFIMRKYFQQGIASLAAR
jgi:multiple sugar transport system permease protein